MATQHAHVQEEEHGYGHEHTHHPNYVRVYVILVVLLAISIAGPMLGVRVVTLITAFGIAVVKAYLVAKNFMHITIAPRYVAYLIGTCLVFMLLFFAGVAPDVMKADGSGWVKEPEWQTAHEARGDHGGGHGAAQEAEGHAVPATQGAGESH
jgi:caa(3)-type oxidase subunit IV